ncbi:hypothetical protein FISHEDRAFT_75700 [Fistulina hepatica ATCC 64428]|uniref:Uncharacterized protein n=1 Tax=Fistulina hepatica ATCC 64428 TaxID=1128425 RepID=A0A0D7A6D3_9AGAR|nr:hypothetical protein FISHEDRAFT_75700 [Fistulina hepatica ATCC 64428]
MEEFADVSEPKMRKALDNIIKDARLKMNRKTDKATNVDAEKVRRRTMGRGMLDQAGKRRFIHENRPAIEKRRQALKSADPAKYDVPGGAGGAFQAAAAQLWAELSEEQREEFDARERDNPDVDQRTCGELAMLYAWRDSRGLLKAGLINAHSITNTDVIARKIKGGLPRQMPQDLRHYFFPPATLFANASSPTRQLANTMNWLFMRSAWIGHLMSMRQPHGLQAQEWRDLLGMTAYHSRRGETTHAQRHAEEILDRVFPGHRFNQLGPTIVYHQRTLPTNCIPPDDVLRDIIWEVNEANLRMEVASLLTLEGEEKNILQVDDILRPIFPGPEDTTFTFWMPIPSAQGHNLGLSADRWQDRVDAVTHLGRHLASVWDDDAMPEAMLRLRTIWNLRAMDLNADEFHALEKMIAKYYCELFYNNFGRSPTVPRRLFDVQY